jgi:hypothetical protein
MLGWLLALRWRKRLGTSLGVHAFRMFQVLLAVLTIAAAAMLF